MNQVVLREDLIAIDDSTTSRSAVWSSEQTYEAIMNYVATNGHGGGFKYMEINDVITLQPGESIKRDYDLGDKSILITTVYLDVENGSIFGLKIRDVPDTGFILYHTGRVSHYTDSVFIPYKDKNPATQNKLHTEITNYNLYAPVVLNLKILGLEMDV